MMERHYGPGTTSATPASRIRVANEAPIRPDGVFVLYWMTASRRTRFNFALQRAVELAEELQRSLVVLEALRLDYPWASDRLHQFVIEGMRDNAAAFASTSVHYLPYVEPQADAARGLLESLADLACAVVTDDSPAFFLPSMLAAAGQRLPVRLEAVDSNGLRPVRGINSDSGPLRTFTAAQHFRRVLQRELPEHLEAFPVAEPLAGIDLPRLPDGALQAIEAQWPAADLASIDLAGLAIDHRVPPAPIAGGSVAGGERLAEFLERGLGEYGGGRNHPDVDGQSGLSPYLHFGQISAHEIVAAILQQEEWTPDRLGPEARSARSGWWGVSAGAEAFLDQLITWRELGYNAAAADPEGYAELTSIPAWAQKTLSLHEADPREQLYDLDTLAAAATDDPVWNAAQRQLVSEGRIHNYLRMLWGKRVIEWTATTAEAFAILEELNNRYALDGRDPNSYSGILWCFGKFDRGWGPERPVFGTVRYMSSANTLRKLRMRAYLERWSGED